MWPQAGRRIMMAPRGDGACILYPGDAGYDTRDLEAYGPRHRLWALSDGFRYERTGSATSEDDPAKAGA